jgi:predicted Zn finger-like uncharacterized protein
MYTQCPECNARFRVGAGDLSAAGGTVRCGRCGCAFNALARLSDTLPPSLGYAFKGPAPKGAAGLGTSPESVSGVEFHFTADDIEAVFVDAGNWPDGPVAAGPRAEASESYAFGAARPMVVESESRSFEDITLEGERINIEAILGIEFEERPDDRTPPVEPLTVESLLNQGAPEAAATAEGPADEHLADEDPTDEFEILRDVPDSAYPEDDDLPRAAVEFEASAPVAPLATEAPPAPVPGTEPADVLDAAPVAGPALAEALAPEPVRMRPGGASLGWSIGGLLLALVLLAQITHQYRQDLVRHPQIGPLLKDVYARIGWPLSPNWDLEAFELRQWGSNSGPDATGRLTVRASLTNRADFAQPHPVLRMELDDRFGDSIAVRDFEPAEYLRNAAEAPRLLGPGASTEAELVIVDPGLHAVGYQLDVCLRESPRVLRCARGPG